MQTLVYLQNCRKRSKSFPCTKQFSQIFCKIDSTFGIQNIPELISEAVMSSNVGLLLSIVFENKCGLLVCIYIERHTCVCIIIHVDGDIAYLYT